jgi:hypothetical protein
LSWGKYHFPNCVSNIDGIHLGLVFEPEVDEEDTRKQEYVVAAMAHCDIIK